MALTLQRQLQHPAVGLAMFATVILVLTQGGAQAAVINIEEEIYRIVSRHNSERRAVDDAADMMEIRWDDGIARFAEGISERCRYERPRLAEYTANLFFETGHVYGRRAIKDLVADALQSWGQGREKFTYSTHCGYTCSYTQMINARADRIGCAMSTCQNMQGARADIPYSTMVVCLYSPGANLLNSYPYTRGRPCSRCASRMNCNSGLCVVPGNENIPRPLAIKGPTVYDQDQLNGNESYSILQAHNSLREATNPNSIPVPLEWDAYLERWAAWIVSCIADYPGPAETFTNFHRLEQGDEVYGTVYKWSLEEGNTNLKQAHSCRTPKDRSRCNHFTNLLQPDLTSMACAARDCKDGTRQLVCLYDNSAKRPARYRSVSYSDLVATRRPATADRTRTRTRSRTRTDGRTNTRRTNVRDNRRNVDRDARRNADRNARRNVDRNTRRNTDRDNRRNMDRDNRRRQRRRRGDTRRQARARRY